MRTLGLTLAVITLGATEHIVNTLQPHFWYLAAALIGAGIGVAVAWATRPADLDRRCHR